jgi:hypothetical protein
MFSPYLSYSRLNLSKRDDENLMALLGFDAQLAPDNVSDPLVGDRALIFLGRSARGMLRTSRIGSRS